MATTTEEVAPAFAQFTAGTTFDSLPDPVVERVKKSILDVLGVGVYGSDYPAVKAPLDYVHRHNKGDDASIFCGGGRATAFGAALVNGTYAHTTEFAEGFTRALVHPGNVVVPAVLAAGERDHRAGQDLLAGVAVSYEILIRLGLSCGLHLSLDLGLHPPAMLGAFASTAAVARMHQFDEAQMANALGVVACHTATPLMRAADQHATVKDLFQGWTAALGVFATDMSSAGLTGVPDWVTPWYHAVPRKYDLEPLLDQLGDFWHVSSGGIRIKTRPVMGMAQPTMQAMAQMVANKQIDHRDIEHIKVESSNRIELGRIYHPTDIVSARAGIPFLAAAALVRPEAFRADKYMTSFLTQEVVDDKDIHALSDKVELVTNPEFDHNLEYAEVSTDGSPYMKFEARVTVTLQDGTVISEYADMFALGTGRMSRDEVADKFRDATKKIIAADRAEKIIETVWSLDEVDDVSELLALMAP